MTHYLDEPSLDWRNTQVIKLHKLLVTYYDTPDRAYELAENAGLQAFRRPIGSENMVTLWRKTMNEMAKQGKLRELARQASQDEGIGDSARVHFVALSNSEPSGPELLPVREESPKTQSAPRDEIAIASFVGRNEALKLYRTTVAYRHMGANAVYYHGRGGTGKSWVLKKIMVDNRDDERRVTPNIIDFFDTDNQSIRGLQITVRSRCQESLAAGEFIRCFCDFDAALAELGNLRQMAGSDRIDAMTYQERRVNLLFVEAVTRAAQGRTLTLLFDTVERVQFRDVGRWFLKDFVDKVRDAVIVLAGRPGPQLSEMPPNVTSYELTGLSLSETKVLIENRPDYDRKVVGDQFVKRMWEASRSGEPLRLLLLLELVPPELLQEPNRPISSEEVDKLIAGRYDDRKDRNRILAAMTYLWRRFDRHMLQYLVDNGELFDEAVSYDDVIQTLGALPFIKPPTGEHSHLLHDEVQAIFAAHLLPKAEDIYNLRAVLDRIIVCQYYDLAIENAHKTGKPELERSLRAEQLGYLLGSDLSQGLTRYQGARDEVENILDYDLEELLWGELGGDERHDCLDQQVDRGYDVWLKRGEWLWRHGRYARTAQHFKSMIERFGDQHSGILDMRNNLGHALLRNGNVLKAIDQFHRCLDLVSQDDLSSTAIISNNLGQAARAAGQWVEALRHFEVAVEGYSRAAAASTPPSRANLIGKAGALSNRGFLFAQMGEYGRAIDQCNNALNILERFPDDDADVNQRRVYAMLNLGTAHRHQGDYESAAYWYNKCLEREQKVGLAQAKCICLLNLGINACLTGRRNRQQRADIAAAVTNQKQAISYILDGLNMARPAQWRQLIADGLSRLARVHIEIARLSEVTNAKRRKDFSELLKVARKVEVPEELEFARSLVGIDSFSKAVWLEKAARLFELSYQVAHDASDEHRAMDSMMQLALILLELKKRDEVLALAEQISKPTDVDYQQDLYPAMASLIIAHLNFDEGRCEEAVGLYQSSLATLAKLSGYPSYLLTDQMPAVEQRLRSRLLDDRAQVHLWCVQLYGAWQDQLVGSTRPDLLDRIQLIKSDTY